MAWVMFMTLKQDLTMYIITCIFFLELPKESSSIRECNLHRMDASSHHSSRRLFKALILFPSKNLPIRNKFILSLPVLLEALLFSYWLILPETYSKKKGAESLLTWMIYLVYKDELIIFKNWTIFMAWSHSTV